MEAMDERMQKRRWTILALTSVGAFMAPLDGSIVSVALPKMGPLLHLGYAASMWVQAAYLLSMAILLIPFGRLADRGGRLRYYLAGILVFTLGSLAAACSINGATLILSRIVQGAGAALLSATSAAIITAVFPERERGRALGINVMVIYVGLSVGPPLGGFLVERFSWTWIFLINLPIGAIVYLWGLGVFPKEPRRAASPSHSDLPGATLLGLFLLCLLVPLTFSSEWGWRLLRSWAMLAAAAACFALLIAQERKREDPMLDLELLRTHRLFAMANLAALLNYMALYAIAILTAAQLQLVQGRSARTTGWVMLAQPALQAAFSPIAGRLSDRMGSRWLSTAGMLITAIGMGMLAFMGRDASLIHVMAALAVVGLGMGVFSSPNTSAIMGSVERSQLSRASAFMATMRVVGQALSVGILGGIAASRLGPGGWRKLLQASSSAASSAPSAAADAFAWGYRAAMFSGAFLVLLGAWASLTRGANEKL
jgi:EmrB/QacA subfamily drug resistance transporter